MKRAFSLLLVFLMLLCLCACSEKETQNAGSGTNPNQSTTESTGNSTGSTTKSSHKSTESSTTATTTGTQALTGSPTLSKGDGQMTEPPGLIPDTDDPGSVETPSTPTDTDSDDSSDCEHAFMEVTCTTPKICTKCEYLAGNALPHNYKDGACTVCGRAEMLMTFLEGYWVAYTVTAGTGEQGEVLSEYVLDPQFERYSSYICYSNAAACSVSTGKIMYNDKAYHSDWYFTTFTSCTCVESEDTITVTLEHTDPIIEFVLTKINETQLKVTASSDTERIPVGIVFNKA